MFLGLCLIIKSTWLLCPSGRLRAGGGRRELARRQPVGVRRVKACPERTQSLPAGRRKTRGTTITAVGARLRAVALQREGASPWARYDAASPRRRSLSLGGKLMVTHAPSGGEGIRRHRYRNSTQGAKVAIVSRLAPKVGAARRELAQCRAVGRSARKVPVARRKRGGPPCPLSERVLGC